METDIESSTILYQNCAISKPVIQFLHTTMIYILLTVYCSLFTWLTWRNFNFALAFLFFCLPTYLIRFNLGPLPTTLLEVMIWIITIIWLMKYHRPTFYILHSTFYKHQSLFLAIALFLLAATISIFTSTNLRSALGEWKAFYVEPIIVFLILITTIQSRYKIQDTNNTQYSISNNIIFALTLCGLFTSLFAILQHFTGWLVPYDFWQNENTFRVTAWYGFPNAVGLFLAPIVPLTIFLIIQKISGLKNKRYKINEMGDKKSISYLLSPISTVSVLALGALASILSIYYARSTGALVALAAGLIFFLFFYNKKTRLIACLVSLVGLVSLICLPQSNPIKQELLFQDRSGQLRVNMWAETTEFLKAHHIAGAGLASYTQAIKPYRIDKWIEVFHHPHNIFLTMWVNTGLLGLFSFVWIIVSIFNFKFLIFKCRFHRASSTESGQFNNLSIFNLCVLTSLVVILVMGLVDSPYIKNDLAILFWLLPALLITSRHCEEEPQR